MCFVENFIVRITLLLLLLSAAMSMFLQISHLNFYIIIFDDQKHTLHNKPAQYFLLSL